MSSTSLLPPLLVVLCFISDMGAARSLAQAAKDADLPAPGSTQKAIAVAKDLGDEALRYDREGGEFPDEYVGKLIRFYKNGTLTKGESGDPVVTQKFCRDYVIALLSDLFAPRKQEPKERDFRNPLDPESEKRFRVVLTWFLMSARQDLAPAQRARLISIAARVLSSDDAGGILALRFLLSDSEPGGEEHTAISKAIDAIESR